MIEVSTPIIPEVTMFINNNILHIIDQMNIQEYTDTELKEFLPMEANNTRAKSVLETLVNIIKNTNPVKINAMDYNVAYMLHSIIDTYCQIKGDEIYDFPYKEELEREVSQDADIVMKNIQKKWGSAKNINTELFRESEWDFDQEGI